LIEHPVNPVIQSKKSVGRDEQDGQDLAYAYGPPNVVISDLQ
jgi:hypothetical protein